MPLSDASRNGGMGQTTAFWEMGNWSEEGDGTSCREVNEDPGSFLVGRHPMVDVVATVRFVSCMPDGDCWTQPAQVSLRVQRSVAKEGGR